LTIDVASVTVSSMRWLTLLASLPRAPTRHRVGVWRKLQRMGAVRLRSTGWILPETPEPTELFQWLVQESQGFNGPAMSLPVDRLAQGAGRGARAQPVGDDGQASARRGDAPARDERAPPNRAAAPGQHVGHAAATPHRPHRLRLAHQALLRSRG